MIRPTARAVYLFAVGAPTALLPLLVDESLWPLALTFLALALLLFGIDAIMAAPGASIGVSIAAPAALFVGESARFGVTLGGRAAGRWAAMVEARCDVNDLLNPQAPLKINLAGRKASDGMKNFCQLDDLQLIETQAMPRRWAELAVGRMRG